MTGGIAIIAALLAVSAAEEPICADRPGKANPSCTVPAGMVEVETAIFDLARDRSGGVRTDELAVGDTAVKFGLTDRLHVEFDVTPYARVRVRDGGVRESWSGFGDIGLAAKWRMTSEDAPVQAALYPFVKIPTAKRPLGNRKVEGGVALLADGGLGDSGLSWNVAPELDLVADSDGSGHHLAMVQVLSIGAALTDRLSVAADLWGQWDWDPAGTVRQVSIGPSAAYLLSNDLQVDAAIDFGLNRNTADVQVYSGVAIRF